jgi:hypothetical protein
MIWIAFEGTDGQLWYMRPFYKDGRRPRKPEYEGLILPQIKDGETSATEGDITVTLGGATDKGVTIYTQTDQERRNRWVEKAIQNPNIPLDVSTVIHEVEHTSVPADHSCSARCEFRNAWEWSDGVKVNMPKARDMHMGRIRVVRDATLRRESGSESRQPAEIEALFTDERKARLQSLRDIPQTFDLETYKTPETLKAAWPAELPDRE